MCFGGVTYGVSTPIPRADVANITLTLEFCFFISEIISFFMRSVCGEWNWAKVLLLVPLILQQTGYPLVFFQRVCKHNHNTLVLNRQLSWDIFLSAWLTHWQVVLGWPCGFHCQGDC